MLQWVQIGNNVHQCVWRLFVGFLVCGFVCLWVSWFWDILEQTQLLIICGIIGSPEKD